MNSKIILKIIIILTIFFSAFSYAKPSQEEIRNFVSQITVNKDASIDVIENITVFANQETIIHGLTRWLPTQYYDNYGILHHTQYQIKKILVNNQETPYYTEDFFNRFAIYIGNRDVTIPAGVYTYTIQYHVNSAISFLKANNQDEFYWNITGNDWELPILRVEATVQLPEGASIKSYTAGTGKIWAKDQHFSQQLLSPNKILFVTTDVLNKNEGLAIDVSWPKGFIHSPTIAEKLKLDFQVDTTAYFLFEICLLILIYYLFMWYLHGRNSHRGKIALFSTPPLGLSPAAMRYISQMKFDTQTFTAAIVNIATKGFFTIQNDENICTLSKKTEDINALSIEEKNIVSTLFQSNYAVSLSPANSEKISAAKNALVESLKKQFNDIYFITPSKYFIRGLIISALAILVVSFSSKDFGSAFFALMWLSMWTFACYILSSNAIHDIKLVLRHTTFSNIFRILRSTLLAIPFLAIEVLAIFLFITSGITSSMAIICLLVIVLLNIIFYHVLKVPTDEGRLLINQIDGFKLFLSARNHSTPMTAELFEKYLPYAIALNVTKQWSEKFNTPPTQGNYQPSWYSGLTWSNSSPTLITKYLHNSIYSSPLPINNSSSYASSGESAS